MPDSRFNPLVSILMTSFNAEAYISQAINSILNQTYTNWELLIADDCSTDNTRNVIAQFQDERIIVYHNDSNLHYLRTRNKLVELVKGTFIALLDADDWYDPNKLELQVGEFAKDPGLGLCGTRIRYVDENGAPLATHDQKPSSYEEILDGIRERNVFTGSSIMVKTPVWKSIGGYRDYFSSFGYEDYDFTSRIVEKHKAINLDKALYFYRQHEDSSSRRNLRYNPFKLHGHLLVKKFMRERATTGQDSLERNDIPAIINFILQVNKKYVDDPSLLYRDLMWSALNRKLYRMAFRHILAAWLKSPLNISNYKAFILFLLISAGIMKE